MIAGFIFLRLRGILGKKSGYEDKMSASFAHDFPADTTKKPLNEQTFDENAKKDFIAGAKIAYETIITSFSSGNLKSVKELLDNNLSDDIPVRIISGNVLTGTKIEADGYMGFFERQITAIREGVEPELFGWLIPKPNKFSISRALPSWFMRQVGKVKYDLDTNKHGEHRAFVVSGEYEKVFPFDIFPVQLLKAILNEDIDAMEKLGLYEVVEEDFALCEVVCTSKINVQNIVRDGLNLLRSEVG